MDDRPRVTRNPASRESPGLDHLSNEQTDGEETRSLPLREEELVVKKHNRQVGEVQVHKQVEEHPGRLEVDARREEVEVLHVPVGKVVEERRDPWQDGDTYVVPIYEEQMALVKRLVLKEEVRVRRLVTTERQVHEENLRRERPVIEDNTERDVVRERFGTVGEPGDTVADTEADDVKEDREGPLDRLARKILE